MITPHDVFVHWYCGVVYMSCEQQCFMIELEINWLVCRTWYLHSML
jgi:hypothetical protein